MHQASVGFHCPECAKSGRQRVYNTRSVATMGGTATKVLIGINLAVFIVGVVITPKSLSIGFNSSGIGRLQLDGGLASVAVYDGEWWRLITSGFLHDGVLHVAFNMYALWILGLVLERMLGAARFVAIYFTALLAGSLGAVIATDPRVLTVGASGAIFGLMGAALAVQRHNRVPLAQGGILPWVVLNLFLTFAIPGISIGGHIGGLIGGAIASWILLEAERRWKSRYAAMGAAFALGVVCFVVALIVAQARTRALIGTVTP